MKNNKINRMAFVAVMDKLNLIQKGLEYFIFVILSILIISTIAFVWTFDFFFIRILLTSGIVFSVMSLLRSAVKETKKMYNEKEIID